MSEESDLGKDPSPKKESTDIQSEMEAALAASKPSPPKPSNAMNDPSTNPVNPSDSQEEAMSDVERQMQEALDQSTMQPPPSRPSRPVHPVEIDEVKPVPRAAPNTDNNLKLILNIPVDVRVEVGSSRLSISEVLNLAPGTIIELDRTAGSPADLIVNGTKVGQGDVVVVDESYGIRLTRLVDPQERINSL